MNVGIRIFSRRTVSSRVEGGAGFFPTWEPPTDGAVWILGVEFRADLPGGFALDARGFVGLCQVHEVVGEGSGGGLLGSLL
jgi:hypothetical protein